jgi:hypothetical protein
MYLYVFQFLTPAVFLGSFICSFLYDYVFAGIFHRGNNKIAGGGDYSHDYFSKLPGLFLFQSMKTIITALLIIALCSDSFGQGGLQPFNLTQIRLLEGPFKQAQETDKRYILSLMRTGFYHLI